MTPTDFESWRTLARQYLAANIPPDAATWSDDDLFQTPVTHAAAAAAFRVPPSFLPSAQAAACHRDESRWALLYRLLWRLTRGAEPHLLHDEIDPDTLALRRLEKAVRRDTHKMRAFVRFRSVAGADGREHFIAWFEPEHLIVRRVAPFFTSRFANMPWSIFTPDLCVHWDQRQLTYTPGVTRSAAPTDDKLEDLWRAYYSHIFNPARLKIDMMRSEMPVKYWKNLPEAQLIPDLIRRASNRVETMRAEPLSEPTAAPKILSRWVSGPETFVEPGEVPLAAESATSLTKLRELANCCHGCPLWKNATQTVPGQGAAHARIMLVGEQPGDQEDLQGKPFVGPAGKLLDRALREIGLDRADIYITNAVKHFKWEPRGKRRLHKSPAAAEYQACRPWLDREIELVKPRVIISLGATAAKVLLGSKFRLMEERGQLLPRQDRDDAYIMATVHPSYLLRIPEEDRRHEEFQAFVTDLRQAAAG